MRQVVVAAIMAAMLAPALASQAPPLQVKVVVRASYTAAGIFAGMTAGLDGGGVDGDLRSIAFKGDRLVVTGVVAGQGRHIIDFTEETTYRTSFNSGPNATLQPNEFRAFTFSQLRATAARNHSSAYTAAPIADDLLPTTGVALPAESLTRSKRFVFSADAKETGALKTVAGIDTREVVITLTAVERGRTLNQDGGWVATTHVWLAPKQAAVDALVAAQRRYAAILAGGRYPAAFTETEVHAAMFIAGEHPELMPVAAQMVAETTKLEGTVLASSSIYKMARTTKEMDRALSQYESQRTRLANMGVRLLGGPPPKQSTIFTLNVEFLSIDPVVSDEEISLPAGAKIIR